MSIIASISLFSEQVSSQIAWDILATPIFIVDSVTAAAVLFYGWHCYSILGLRLLVLSNVSLEAMVNASIVVYYCL